MNLRKFVCAASLATFVLTGCSSKSEPVEQPEETTTAVVTTTETTTTEATTEAFNEGKVEVEAFTRGVTLATVNYEDTTISILSGSRLSDIIKATGFNYEIYENNVDELHAKVFDFYKTISLKPNTPPGAPKALTDMDIFVDIVDSEGNRITNPNPANFTQYFVAGIAFTGTTDTVQNMTSYNNVKLGMARDEVNSCLGSMSTKSTICTTEDQIIYVDYDYTDHSGIIYSLPIELGRDTTTIHDAEEPDATEPTQTTPDAPIAPIIS